MTKTAVTSTAGSCAVTQIVKPEPVSDNPALDVRSLAALRRCPTEARVRQNDLAFRPESHEPPEVHHYAARVGTCGGQQYWTVPTTCSQNYPKFCWTSH